MEQKDGEAAASYWTEHAAKEAAMAQNQLKAAFSKLIREHNTCALATAPDNQPRCTPVEYLYAEGCLWIFSEGGLKFKALAQNDRVGLAVFDAYAGFSSLNSVQLTARAEIVTPWSETYLRIAALRNLSEAALRRLPHTLHLIRMIPLEAELLCSDFKKQGFSPRQHLDFSGEVKR